LLLNVGSTCWRVETSDRLGLIMDMADYFAAAKAAMLKATRSIHLLNWAFDPDTFFLPDREGSGPPDDRFGPFLRDLARHRPELDVRILCWRSALPVAATQNFFPHRAKACFQGTPVKFRLDGSLPLGACHHQKVIVIDDRLAFCGGGDIAPDRWDTCEHLDDDPRRQKTAGKSYESRHETMSAVDGDAARALGTLFRMRWERSSGEALPAPAPLASAGFQSPQNGDGGEGGAQTCGDGAPRPDASADLWPECLEVRARMVRVGLSRTEPDWRGYSEVREAEALHLAAIAAARRSIYMENQYFASPVMAEALAARLAEADGPEVVLISTQHSPSWFDQMTMDKTRILFLKRLKDVDRYNRCHAYFPRTAKGRSIIVHSKLTIIDDDLVRIGSANLNNRSTGFDTECDLSVEAEVGAAGEDARAAIKSFRLRLLGHWLNIPPEALEAFIEADGSIHRAVERFDAPGRRLQAIAITPIGPLWEFIAAYHLGDPAGPKDSWRPWRRRAEIERQLAVLAEDMRKAGLRSPIEGLDPQTV
jgi:phosphatidylserine/phosphatidylglycerophosphate/cardiolipin synthase-like enzyme